MGDAVRRFVEDGVHSVWVLGEGVVVGRVGVEDVVGWVLGVKG